MRGLEENWFECYICHRIFMKGWSEAEATEEYEREFPSCENESKEVVCGECYEKFRERN